MTKYIAFDLYRKNKYGGHDKALQLTQPSGTQVVLVADLEDLLWKIESADNPKLVAGTALKDLMVK